MVRKYILVTGLVQGIGFRPYIYKIALKNNLKGFVKNSNVGVIIDIEGEKSSIGNFLYQLKEGGPEALSIDKIVIEDKELINYKVFKIEKSSKESRGITFISPDLGTCKECYKEIMNKENKRYMYPFTNCTKCGPRYSIIKSLPYDRFATTMNFFNMCNECNEEYKNILNRRFHAESNCCAICGPKLQLIDNEGRVVNTLNPIEEVIKFLKEDKIISIKGIGGFHLVCNGKSENTIELLRKRKYRERKPFAVMIKDIETVKKYCYLSKEEEKILSSNKRPIVVLDTIEDKLPLNIAPGNNTLGVMLPYSPIHYLLFQKELEVLVMTSANLNGMPIVYKNEDAISQLSEIVDYHLINNREIYNAIDDSVVRVILGEERVIRRGRGYSPTYLKGDGFKESISLGSYLKNNFCLVTKENIILSQYIGNLDNVETLKRYYMSIRNLSGIYNAKPELIVYDFHPGGFSKGYLKTFKGKKIGVYHHHAHLASVLFENREKDKVIGVAYDGSGFGEDGAIWGGEFLIVDCKKFSRVGHLNSVQMPGGDKAVKEPVRMAISYLYKTYKNKIDEVLNLINFNLIEKKYIQIIRKNINCPKTSSMGRLFDAVSYLLGFNRNVTYEGEAAIYLENISIAGVVESYYFDIDLKNQKYIINTDKIIIGVIEDIKKQIKPGIISRKFHNTIIKLTLELCLQISNVNKIKKVALSGGVFQNKILLEGVYNALKQNGFIVYINKQVPCNDGGISLGQIVIANAREME
ncbi:carbamoyltransferase HypF [Clostridium cibarium]|uniref:Carbamoyltransferase n=1 Tax=Clostridium cibarium TaxID=2762247 RepID=A0ABR8PRM1_9CLOT|nr:carbamoyltransferase HypF [Clostridium cibarium]